MSKSSYPGNGGSTVLLGLAALVAGAFAGYSMGVGACRDKAPAPSPSVSVTSTVRGMQQGVQLPPCAHEDGNSDGRPCLWTDPASRRVDVVDSVEYR